MISTRVRDIIDRSLTIYSCFLYLPSKSPIADASMCSIRSIKSSNCWYGSFSTVIILVCLHKKFLIFCWRTYCHSTNHNSCGRGGGGGEVLTTWDWVGSDRLRLVLELCPVEIRSWVVFTQSVWNIRKSDISRNTTVVKNLYRLLILQGSSNSNLIQWRIV